MLKNEQNFSPLERWLAANQNSANIGQALRQLLGHAFVSIFRHQNSKSSIFSPEKAISLAQRLPSEVLPKDFGNWLATPEKFALDIVHFCEKAENFKFPEGFDLSEFSSGAVDLRGVLCPLSSARARLVLAGMDAGEEVTLFVEDGEPIENVPRAMLEDGNKVVFRTKKSTYWELRVLKQKISN